ncbi:MAG: hypothetical protein ACRD3J_32125 [Thermoanaerobaculia bacterium]
MPEEPLSSGGFIPPASTETYTFDHRLHDMSETAANALTQVADYTHAVPARQETVRGAIAAGVVLLAGAFLAWMMKTAVDAGQYDFAANLVWPFACIVLVLGAGQAADSIVKRVTKGAGGGT